MISSPEKPPTNTRIIYEITRQNPCSVTNAIYESLNGVRKIILPQFAIFRNDTMIKTIAILVMSGGNPIIAKRVKLSILRVGEIVCPKRSINERKTNHFFIVRTQRITRIILKIATRRQC